MNLRPTLRTRPSWKPRLRSKFALKAKPRFNRVSLKQRKEAQKRCCKKPLRNTPAAGQRNTKAGRRVNRIGKHWLHKPAVVYRGEREICNPATIEGRAEYKWRTLLMWVRQDGWCCFREYDFCPGRLHLKDATFEHEGKRTRGQQDDRLSYFDAAGKEHALNGAAHAECNGIAGSRKLPIWHGNVIFELKGAA